MTTATPYHKAHFGQYRLIRELGLGGMGVVYLAEDTRLERKIALKMLARHLNSDRLLRDRFVREARAAARLNHPNVVTVFDVGDVDGQTYYTMQHVSGRTLREVIDIGHLSLDEITANFSAVCSAIAHAHEHGIIHRDIKPANIILGEDGRPMVLDFGLAKVQSESDSLQDASAIGTVNYMSPEQAQGKPVDTRSDIFSLGVVLYELLTGICPFVRGYIPATVQAIVHTPARPLTTYRASLAEGWQHVLDRALAKDPVHRYQTIEELGRDIEQLRAGQAIAGSRPDHPPQPKLQRNAVAVLYLRNIGESKDEYLSYGLTEDLIIDLTRYAHLHVVPMRRILKYRDTTLEIDAIARELGVALVLDGSLLRSGDTFRLSAQLYDVVAGTARWASRWEEPTTQLHEVKRAFAEAVARAARGDEIDQTVSVSGGESEVSPVAYEYYLRGNFLFEHKQDRSDVEAAMGLFQKAVDFDRGLLAARAGIASVYIFRSDYGQAQQVLEEALTEAKHRGRLSEAARMATMLGYVHALKSEFPKAHGYLDDALSLSREAGNLMREVEACAQKLMICKLSGKVTGGVELFERAMELADRLGDDFMTVKVLGNMAWIHMNEGDPLKARKMLMTALPIARERGDKFTEAFLLNSIAATYMGTVSQNSAKKELEYYLKAREIWKHLKYERASGGQANNLGLVYQRQGRFREAHDSYEHGVKWMKQLGERSYHSMFLANLSGAQTALGRYQAASESARDALAIAEEIDQQPFRAQALVALALAEHAQGRSEDAERLVNRALELSNDQAAQWQTVSARTLLGEIYFDIGQFEKAQPFLQAAIDGAEKAGYEELAVRSACYLAAIAGISDNDKDADRQLSELAELTEGLYLWYVCQRLRGHMKLVGIGSESDKAEAIAHLKEVRAATEKAEYKFETDRIDAVLAAVG